MKPVRQDLADQLGRALNELRGHQTGSEPTLIALVYLRLLDIKSYLEVDPTYPRTKNTQAVTIPSELRWQQIVNSDYPGELALRAIEFIDSLYGDLFSGLINQEAIALISGNPQLGRQLVEIVQELKLDQTADNELPALADELTTLLFTYQGVQAGEFYTPTDLTALVIQLANPRSSDSVYDPACGTGGFLTAAFYHATQTGSPLRTGAIVGSDINTHVASIARLNALLHGFPVSSIETADSLAGLSNGDKSQRFDIILTDLPVGLRYNDTALQRLEHAAALQFTYGPATRIADFNFIQHSLSRLNDTGRAVILTSLRVLFVSGRESIVRKALIDSDVIEAVITLPSHILPHTGAQPAILVFNKSKPVDRQRKVLFIHADEEFEQGTRLRRTLGNLNQQRILDAFRGGSSEMRFSASVTNDAIAARDYVLIPSSYVGFDDIQVFLGADVEHIELNQLGVVLKGMRLAHQKDGTAPILQGRDLSVPFLTIDDLSKRELPQIVPSVSTSRVGDILIQRIGQTPCALLVEEYLVGIPISDTVYIIRPEQDDRLRARYLVEFLNSSVGQAKLSTCLSGSVIPTLGLSKLRNLRIPIPHRSVMEIIRDLQDVERTLTQRAHKSRLLRSQLFSIESEDVFNQRLQGLTVESQVLKQSIIQAEDLDFQMRNYFPHVISYSYRFLDAIQNEAQLYKEQLRVAENFLAFLGSVGLALVVESRSTQGAESRGLTYQMLCEFWQGGISPGH